MFQKVFEYAGPHKKGLYAATAVVLVSVLMGGSSLCAGLSGNRAVSHGGGNRCFFYHPASGIGAGMPGAASYSLWLGAEHLT